MNKIMHALVGVLITITGLGVGNAHSQTSPVSSGVGHYVSRNWFLNNCELMVERKGDTVYFTPNSQTRTVFLGFVPNGAGRMDIPAVTRSALSFDGGLELIVESLSIDFEMVDGDLQPVGYSYNREHQNDRRPLSFPTDCQGLRLAN